jgi:hypothetical protein
LSYKIRNSIILGVLLLLVVGIGAYIRVFNLPKKLEAIDKEVRRIDEELQNTPNLVNTYNDRSATLADMQKRWETRNKDIPPTDVTAQTYNYFSELIDKSGYLKLDMIYQRMDQRGNYGFNVYNLKGEAPFENYYRFVWYLENGRKLYKINTINVRGLEIPPKDDEEGQILVTFEMEVHAYFSSVAELASSLGDRSLSPNYLAVDPFMPVIARDVQPNFRSLVEIERSDLKAVITGKAFILDQNNVIRTLGEGDEVYLGYVTRLSPETGSIECTLNKGGIIEKVERKIRYGVDQKNPQSVTK